MDLPVRWFVVVLSGRLRGECESENFNKVTRKQDDKVSNPMELQQS